MDNNQNELCEANSSRKCFVMKSMTNFGDDIT